MVVEGPELMESLRILFETKKSFITDVKLVEKDVWLNLSAGPMNDNFATIVATGILLLLFFMCFIFLFFYLFVDLFICIFVCFLFVCLFCFVLFGWLVG
jgi:hypothetical protein